MTFDEQKEILKQAIDMSDTPIEVFKNIFDISYEKGRERATEEYWDNIAAIRRSKNSSKKLDV